MTQDGLESLFRAYFCAASDLADGTPEELLEQYTRLHTPGELAQVAALLRVLLDEHESDEDLAHAVQQQGGNWPADDRERMRSVLERCWMRWSTASD